MRVHTYVAHDASSSQEVRITMTRGYVQVVVHQMFTAPQTRTGAFDFYR